ncbi:hypothetical protein DFN09_002060 [Clostridium acetobutylicum]|nr:hypothetical protein [Clostridium acetobutylicum]
MFFFSSEFKFRLLQLIAFADLKAVLVQGYGLPQLWQYDGILYSCPNESTPST